MAEVRCPSCGKSNPETLEICQFCGTQLAQLHTEPLEPLSPGELPVKKDTAELERTLPGWLRNARRAGKEDAAPANSEPDSPPEAPLDLLAGLAQGGEEEEEAPDWLKSLRESSPAPTSAAPSAPEPPQSNGSAPDWLAELQDQPVEAEKLPQPEDWGFSSQATTYHFDEGDETPLPPAGDIPDWLSALQAHESVAIETPQTDAGSFSFPPEGDAGETPDWLAELGGGFTASEPEVLEDTPAPARAVNIPASDLPDWMAGLAESSPSTPEAPAESATPASDLPDWMAGLAESSPSTPEAPAESATPASDLPDWMAGLAESSPSTPEAPAEGATPTSDLPDWMAGLAESSPSTPEAPAESATPASDLPDWMAGLAESSPSTPEAPAESATPASNMPDWMAEIAESAPLPAAESAAPPAPEAEAHTDLPEWLSTAMGESAPEVQAEDKQAAMPFPSNSLDELGDLSQENAVPDFMSGLFPDDGSAALPGWLKTKEPAPLEEEEKADPFSIFETEPQAVETPAIEPGAVPFTVPVDVEPDEDIDSFLKMDIPDWLSSFTPASEAEQPASAEADLRPGDLPSWVQAMRPVESVLSGANGDEEEGLEEQGPLAGLYSVLPAQAALQEFRKPKTYSIKLQVNETQRAQAELLENLLNSESRASAAGVEKESLLMRPVRWIIFAALTLVVLIPALLGTSMLPAPAIPADAGNPFNLFYETVNAKIPDDSALLVVTDYQPGYSGEMEQAAVPVLVNLMRKNARLAFISTSTISTELGERLVEKANTFSQKNGTGAPLYERDRQYLFLGYLPGAAAGVRAFSEHPQQTTGLDSLSGNLWQSPILNFSAMDTISSFAAVLVITDDPDQGRLWIEQAGPELGDKPMLMVASAQAGPMLQPYVVSGQLTGLVSGLEGGVLYEKKNAESRPADPYPGDAKSLYWDGFGAAVLVSGISILVGGVWSLVVNFLARRNDSKQDEA